MHVTTFNRSTPNWRKSNSKVNFVISNNSGINNTKSIVHEVYLKLTQESQKKKNGTRKNYFMYMASCNWWKNSEITGRVAVDPIDNNVLPLIIITSTIVKNIVCMYHSSCNGCRCYIQQLYQILPPNKTVNEQS